MLRYFFLQKLYPILDLFTKIYFFVVNQWFNLFYLFKQKTKVEWNNEELASPFLFISAKKAAEKIRNKEVFLCLCLFGMSLLFYVFLLVAY